MFIVRNAYLQVALLVYLYSDANIVGREAVTQNALSKESNDLEVY